MVVKELDSIGISDHILTPNKHEDLSCEISIISEASRVIWGIVTIDQDGRQEIMILGLLDVGSNCSDLVL